jgi:pimeloyl-ACP methyl ester carboxylesterase
MEMANLVCSLCASLINAFEVSMSSCKCPLPVSLSLCSLRIGAISCPIFVIHGTRDEIVPFWNGEELFLAAPIQWRACPYWVEKAGHNDVELVQK